MKHDMPRQRTPDETAVPATAAKHDMGSRAFWSFLTTQFLGAFNDNYFKQMVLLTCASRVAQTVAAPGGTSAPDRQPLGLAAFALPFVLLSGIGGFLSDRTSKKRVIVGCKVAEIVITAIGLGVLLIPGVTSDSQLLFLIGVLALMGAHSAIFGPSKYGVLPELFQPQQLLPVNGAVQMTTFLAIIFGTACAGLALDRIGNDLWLGSCVAVGIAVCGTLASIPIPSTPVAAPGLTLKLESLAVPMDVARMIRQTRGLTMAILIATVFWFLGGVTQVAVNTLGVGTLLLNKTRTSLLVATIGIGIAAGCAATGYIGRTSGGSRTVVAGAWLLLVSLCMTAVLGSGVCGWTDSRGVKAEAFLRSLLVADGLEWSLRGTMALLGFAAGMFVVPVQVFLQQAPPAEYKGRLIGVQNFATWIGILLSAVYAEVVGRLLVAFDGKGGDARLQWVMFASLAALMLPICLAYRLPRSTEQS